jgi:hypothetical protein
MWCADRRAFSRGRRSNRSKWHGPLPVAQTAGFAVYGSSLTRAIRWHGMTPGMEETCLLSPPEQAHGDKEIGKKRTPELRTRRYRAELRHRDPAQRDGKTAMRAAEKTRTTKGVVHATCLLSHFAAFSWRAFFFCADLICFSTSP